MDYKVCCFVGHNDTEFTEELKERVKTKIEELIEKENYGVFKFGGMGGFDYGCWEIVNELKQKYPFIKTVLCIWEGKLPWWAKKRKYDDVEILPLNFDYWYSHLYYRNTAMIDTCDYCLFYVCNTENSGAYKAMKYAAIHKKAYTNFGVIEKK